MVGLAGADRAPGQSTEASDPSLAERYRDARLEMLARRLLGPTGRLPTLGPIHHPTPSDSLRPERPGEVSTPKDGFPLGNVRTVERLERSWFRERFTDTEWAFLGSTPRPTFFDTTRTPELRARLQAHFGTPTQTLADARPGTPQDERPDSSWADRAQFEYWFVVNDSIPVRVMDARGPRDRGLILATHRRLRERLPAVRDALLAPLRQPLRAAYVDHYYDPRLQHWYRTGYDGRTFFLDQIARSEVVPGERPQLDAERSAPGTAPQPEGNRSSGQ